MWGVSTTLLNLIRSPLYGSLLYTSNPTPPIFFVDNPSNSAFSSYKAIQKLDLKDYLHINCDILFTQDLLIKLIHSRFALKMNWRPTKIAPSVR